MELSAKLTLDTGPFAAALADALKAVESLAAETGGLSKAVAEAQSRLAEMAEEASKASEGHDALAAAEKEAADASGELAEANKAAAESEGELAEQADNAAGVANAAKAASAGLGAAQAAMTGDAASAARGIMGLSNALKGLGVSMSAVLGAGLAVELAALGKAISDMQARAEQARLDRAFDNARAAADGLLRSVERVSAELRRAGELRRGLAGTADEAADLAHRTELAKLEAERARALAGAPEGDRAGIAARFDRRRAELEYAHGMSGLGKAGAEIAANQAEAGALRERQGELAAAIARALEASSAAGARASAMASSDLDAAYNSKSIERELEEQRRQGELAAELTRKAGEIAEQIKGLEARNEVLSAQGGLDGARAGLLAAERDAAMARVEASLANAAKEASKAAAGSGKAGGVGGEGRIASDRLTRIGGYMGGSSPMRTSEDLLRKANEQRAEMIAAIRDRNGGTFG